MLDDLIRFDIIKSYDEITGVGHRVVRWRIFQRISLVDEDALAKIEELSALAPLHNPGATSGIRAFKELLPDITSVAVLIQPSYIYAGSGLPLSSAPIVTIQTTKSVSMEHTELVTNMFLKSKPKLLGKPIEETKLSQPMSEMVFQLLPLMVVNQ